jgi:hypothetical protein
MFICMERGDLLIGIKHRVAGREETIRRGGTAVS